MSVSEVSNEQFAKFNARHDSRFEDRTSWIFSEEFLGWPLNKPRQPVVRVSWNEAMDFCQWLTQKTQDKATLPSEAQWEYACRAGTATPFFYGGFESDFSLYANLGDMNLRRLATEGWRPLSPDLIPRDNRYDDGALVTRETGGYKPNSWGLYDMHGNAAEWTRSDYSSALKVNLATAETFQADAPKTVRGGSWRDRPFRATSSFRLAYPPYEKIFNTGFRVIIETTSKNR
jgi:formylglycine-generating enzyme required for sulfatase activity